MAALEDFRRLIGGRAPTCPAPVLYDNIRIAASEFCARTRVWRERVTKEIDEDCTGYAPTLPNGAIVHEIESAWWGDHSCPLTAIAFDDLDPMHLDEHGPSLIPRYITQRTLGVFRVVPRGAGTLILNLILKPPSGTTEGAVVTLPDFLLHHFGEAIACGGLARALATAEQAWTDPAGAAVAAAMFEGAATTASSYNTRGQQRAPRRSRFSWV